MIRPTDVIRWFIYMVLNRVSCNSTVERIKIITCGSHDGAQTPLICLLIS